MKIYWGKIKEILIVIEGYHSLEKIEVLNYLSPKRYYYWLSNTEEPNAFDMISEINQQEYMRKVRSKFYPCFNMHLQIMKDEGLVVGEYDVENPKNTDLRLTLKGCDLLELMKCSALWSKIETAIKDKKLPMTYMTIIELGKKFTLSEIEKI